MLASTGIAPQPDSTACADAGAALVASMQVDNGGVNGAAPTWVNPFGPYLYLLASSAQTGPQAGLFKLGISGRLTDRHREHTRNWQEFDLTRSALVRVSSHSEARHLETSLRWHFSSPEAEARAKAAGQQLSAAEFIDLRSCRRNPGQRKAGCTEFFAIECMEKMLEAAEYLMACGGNMAAGASIQRGITLPPPTVAAKRPSDAPKRTKKKCVALSGDWMVQLAQEEQEQTTQIVAKASRLLDLALAYERHVVWVDLSWWRHLLRYGQLPPSPSKALADVYFGFEPTLKEAGAKSAHPPLTRARFEEYVAPIVALTGPLVPGGWEWESPEEICRLEETPDFCGLPPPHFVCVDRPRVRLAPWPPTMCRPLFAQYEALARRVENRDHREQGELW